MRVGSTALQPPQLMGLIALSAVIQGGAFWVLLNLLANYETERDTFPAEGVYLRDFLLIPQTLVAISILNVGFVVRSAVAASGRGRISLLALAAVLTACTAINGLLALNLSQSLAWWHTL